MDPRPSPQIVISAGEPAGIGPDILLVALTREHTLDASIRVAGDPAVLRERAALLGLEVQIHEIDAVTSPPAHLPGQIHVIPTPVAQRVTPGKLDPRNAASVIRCIDIATDLCLEGEARAVVTAPVHKAAINDGGIAFQGHTEWIAQRTGSALPVMMLASPKLRVCLATTHIPLSAVPSAITRELLVDVLRIMDRDIGALYDIPHPEIGVLGLNPHAGENGYLGHEELDTIIPALESLRASGVRVTGPLPADTAFARHHLDQFDAILAMYHDQGLPVIKHQDFGDIVNVTLGLPIVRTSVDHGTALDLAGTGRASASSMTSAILLAIRFAHNRGPEVT